MASSGTLHWIYRHSAIVRLTHWMNAVCLIVLLMSGLQIFNAHPALYWGSASTFDDPAIALTAIEDQAGDLRGLTKIGRFSLSTTGVLGASAGPDGDLEVRGFPAWITLPSYQELAAGRRWHFFFAWALVLNGALYLLAGLFSGHFRRDLMPSGAQLKRIGASIRDHLHLRFPQGEEAAYYNVLQKLAYLAVMLLLLPLMVASGLAMSPALDAAFPGLAAAFGGRQSARTIHFLTANALVLFGAVHIAMVLLSGAWNNLRAMITGWYTIRAGGPHA